MSPFLFPQGHVPIRRGPNTYDLIKPALPPEGPICKRTGGWGAVRPIACSENASLAVCLQSLVSWLWTILILSPSWPPAQSDTGRATSAEGQVAAGVAASWHSSTVGAGREPQHGSTLVSLLLAKDFWVLFSPFQTLFLLKDLISYTFISSGLHVKQERERCKMCVRESQKGIGRMC